MVNLLSLNIQRPFSFRIIIITCSIQIFCSSCETEIIPYGKFENLPVVYSIINPDDSIHYLKLTRTFQGHTNPSLTARITDSIYFEDADVKLEIRTETGWVIYRNSFKKVTNYQKEAGFFGTAINELYQLEDSLNKYIKVGYKVFLIVDIPGFDKVTSASSEILNRPKIINPDQWDRMLMLVDSVPQEIEWLGCEDCMYYELKFRINFTEIRYGRICDNFAEINYTYPVGNLYIDQDHFFRSLSNTITPDSNVIRRIYKGIDIFIQATGQEFKDYKDLYIKAADNNGKPYTNIVNGMGIFTTVFEGSRKGLKLEIKTRDSLSNGRFTKHLKFVF